MNINPVIPSLCQFSIFVLLKKLIYVSKFPFKLNAKFVDDDFIVLSNITQLSMNYYLLFEIISFYYTFDSNFSCCYINCQQK